MPKRKKDYCGECGAELKLRPASCPLCGASTEGRSWVAEATKVEDPEDYQSNVRELRDQLRKLRSDGAEAV